MLPQVRPQKYKDMHMDKEFVFKNQPQITIKANTMLDIQEQFGIIQKAASI